MTHEDLALLDTLRALQGYLLQILIQSFYGCLISNRQTDRQTEERGATLDLVTREGLQHKIVTMQHSSCTVVMHVAVLFLSDHKQEAKLSLG